MLRKGFRLVRILAPKDFRIRNYPREPLAAFNPAVWLDGNTIHLFPRLVFDYFDYNSSIGHAKLSLESLSKGKFPLSTNIVIWPSKPWERATDRIIGHGCEDPRAYHDGNQLYLSYTGASSKYGTPFAYLGIAELNSDFSAKKKYTLLVAGRRISAKNGTFLWLNEERKGIFLFRPQESLSCYAGQVDLVTKNIKRPREVITPSLNEIKVGWSTNAVELDKNTYLIGWHAKTKSLVYRQYLALLDNKGMLITKSPVVLSPAGILLQYGDRSSVIYGCGLLVINDSLYWFGGIGDYSIGIWKARLKAILRQLS